MYIHLHIGWARMYLHFHIGWARMYIHLHIGWARMYIHLHIGWARMYIHVHIGWARTCLHTSGPGLQRHPLCPRAIRKYYLSFPRAIREYCLSLSLPSALCYALRSRPTMTPDLSKGVSCWAIVIINIILLLSLLYIIIIIIITLCCPQVQAYNDTRSIQGRFLLGHRVVDSFSGGTFVLDLSSAMVRAAWLCALKSFDFVKTTVLLTKVDQCAGSFVSNGACCLVVSNEIV